jgi:hypothetical protein
MKDRLRSIVNIPFLICLALLLLNDFYLKAVYHNTLTGKLSDFCGLFVFVTFWSAILPGRKQTIFFSTTLIFIVWKSPYSETFIDFFSRTFYPINRTVDITDLIALAILPIGFFYMRVSTTKLKVNPIPLAALTLFAFCATSVPDPSQKFEQPQYILFKSGVVNFSDSDYPSNYQVYDHDSLIVIGIQEMRIDKHAPIDDEFHKKQILVDLDLSLLRESQDRDGITGSQSYFKSLRDSLTIHGKTAVTLKLDSVVDELNFKDTRLDGKFKRISDRNQLIIEGTFKNGIEDSTWTFYDRSNGIVVRKYFQDGELTKTEQFENSNLIATEDHDTRDDTITKKYFHLAILGVCIILMMAKLFSNYRRSQQKDIIQLSVFSAMACVGLLPLFVLIIANVISNFIPNAYWTFFGIVQEAFLIYVVTAPLFLLVLVFVKLRSWFDLILYILIFSLAVVFIEEWSFLKVISP